MLFRDDFFFNNLYIYIYMCVFEAISIFSSLTVFLYLLCEDFFLKKKPFDRANATTVWPNKISPGRNHSTSFYDTYVDT